MTTSNHVCNLQKILFTEIWSTYDWWYIIIIIFAPNCKVPHLQGLNEQAITTVTLIQALQIWTS